MDNQDDSPDSQDEGSASPEATPTARPAADTPEPVDIDGKKALLAGGILLLVILVVVGIVYVAKRSDSSDSSSTATTQPKAGSACGTGAWPNLYKGQPANLTAATDTGYYVWWDTKGWHLRVIDTGSLTTFKGTITTEQSTKIDPKRYTVTPADSGTLEIKGNVVSFTFSGGPAAKGIDFTPCASLFHVSMGTESLPWPLESIWVGTNNKAPANPIVPERS